MRKSFWEHANELSDLGAELYRIQKLLLKDKLDFEVRGFGVCTLEEYIDEYYFESWSRKHRLTYLSINDAICSLGLKDIAIRIQCSENRIDALRDFLLYIESIYNMMMAIPSLDSRAHMVSQRIQDNIAINCARLNFEIKADADDRYIIVEKNAAATAVADQYISSDKDFSFKVIEYNHFLLKGDLKRKEEILIKLWKKFEPLRPKLREGGYTQVESDAGFLLNNLNLRHNNVTSGDKGKYRALVAGMSNQDLEEWYDKTYDALLFALQADNYIDLSKNVGTLKKQINAADKPTP